MAIYRYPYKKIENSEDYLKIECLEYKPPGINEINENLNSFFQPGSDENYRNIGTTNIRGTIILPIPDGLPQNANSVEWGGSTLGPLQTSALGVAENTITGGIFKGADALKQAITTGVNAVTQTGRGQKMVQTFFASKAVEQLIGQGDQDLFGTILGRTTGAVFNQNVEVLFKGLKLRAPFTFSFDISPRFKEEAEKVKELIVFLKKEMAARKGNTSGAAAGLFLTAPSVFKIQYMSGIKPHPYLNTFKICALTDLSLGFNGSNVYSTYSDGTPVHMQLGLSFRELTPIYDTDYDKGAGLDGVGY